MNLESRSWLLQRSQLLFDGLLQRLGLGGGSPTAFNGAIGADEELLKVPLDHLQAHDARLLLLQPLVYGGGLAAVYINLAKNREGDAVVDLAKLLDLVVGAGVLRAELVTGEADDGEFVTMCLLYVLIELFKALELRCEAAFGSSVDHENNFAL